MRWLSPSHWIRRYRFGCTNSGLTGRIAGKNQCPGWVECCKDPWWKPWQFLWLKPYLWQRSRQSRYQHQCMPWPIQKQTNKQTKQTKQNGFGWAKRMKRIEKMHNMEYNLQNETSAISTTGNLGTNSRSDSSCHLIQSISWCCSDRRWLLNNQRASIGENDGTGSGACASRVRVGRQCEGIGTARG